MKKVFNVFFFIFLNSILCTISAENLYDAKYNGTYIPEIVYNTVVETNSYYEGIKASNNTDIYTVLSLGDMIMSNLKFHDSYAPSGLKISFEEKSDTIILTDTKTNVTYRKISDSTDYYSAYDNFLLVYCMLFLKNNTIDYEISNGKVKIFDKEWYIDKDQWHYSEGIKLILYEKTHWTFIGIVEKDGKDCFYKLKNEYDLVYTPDELITK